MLFRKLSDVQFLQKYEWEQSVKIVELSCKSSYKEWKNESQFVIDSLSKKIMSIFSKNGLNFPKVISWILESLDGCFTEICASDFYRVFFSFGLSLIF